MGQRECASAHDASLDTLPGKVLPRLRRLPLRLGVDGRAGVALVGHPEGIPEAFPGRVTPIASHGCETATRCQSG